MLPLACSMLLSLVLLLTRFVNRWVTWFKRAGPGGHRACHCPTSAQPLCVDRFHYFDRLIGFIITPSSGQ